jgi:HD superfamily phosphodiesterase
MKPVFEKIRQLSKPFLDTRHNDVHTEISTQLAFELFEREGGDEDIVIPAIILHDTGWQRVPVDLHLKAFGPNPSRPELNRLHEVEGVKIAEEILQQVKYDSSKTKKILEIIDGHDSRPKADSLNEMIVKDADKLWRYSTYAEGLDRLRTHIFDQLFTATAKEIATEKLIRREKEKTG